MIEAINSIILIIKTLVSFVINTFTSLITLFSHIPTYLVYITSLINILPRFVLPFATAYVSIAIVLFILNRRA